MEQICELCHKEPARPGFALCDRCKGFDPLAGSGSFQQPGPPVTRQPPTETTPNLCETCGRLIEPYKIGKHTKTKGECRNCYHKRRFGPNWKPGGQTKEEKAAKCKAWREERKAERIGTKTLQPDPIEPNEDKCNMVIQDDNISNEAPSELLAEIGTKVITIPFEGTDEAMFERLRALATKERRSMEQQVLYFLDRVIEV